MGNFLTKEVNFNGATLMAVQTKDGKIHVGVRWICQGLGLNDNQRIAQAKKIREDIVLSKGVIKKLLPTSNGKQEVLWYRPMQEIQGDKVLKRGDCKINLPFRLMIQFSNQEEN